MIESTAAELRARALAATDAGGYFAAMYARVTQRVADAVHAGRFEDADRMDQLATTFAGRYLRALDAPDEAPRCWQASWAVAGDADLLIVQHLLLGINAHVNHDLPLAVVDVAGPGPGALADLRPDFDAINAILAETYGELVADLDRVSRWTAAGDRLLGGRVFRFSLEVARDQAWRAAQRLHPLDPGDLVGAQAELDELVAVLAYLVTRPPRLLSPVLWLARRFEEREPRTVVRALLGAGA